MSTNFKMSFEPFLVEELLTGKKENIIVKSIISSLRPRIIKTVFFKHLHYYTLKLNNILGKFLSKELTFIKHCNYNTYKKML